MINLVYISGLWDPSGGPLNGFRNFSDRMVVDYGVSFQAMSYLDKYLVRQIAMLSDSLVVVAHSNGGDAYLRDVDPWLVRINRSAIALCCLDAKPRWSWNPLSLARWSFQREYPLPQSAADFHAFHGGFGCGFVKGINSTRMNIDHPDFPGDERVHAWIEQRIKAAA